MFMFKPGNCHPRSFFTIFFLISYILLSLPAQADNFICQFSVTSEWSSGAVAKLQLTNDSNEAREWTEITVSFPAITIQRLDGWGAEYSGNNPIIIRPTPWNNILQPHQTLEFGMQVSKPAGSSLPAPVLGGDCVDNNQPPVASLKITNVLESLVNLDATESYDPDGDELTYTWTINGNLYSTSSNFLGSVNLSKGNHVISVTVSDGQLSDTITQNFYMSYPPTFNPVAEFTYNVDGTTVTVDGSKSRALGIIGVYIYGYYWDFGDGTTSTGVSASHTYAQPGVYPITLQVYDSNLASSTTTQTVTIGTSTNQPPVVDFSCRNGQLIGDNFELGLATTVHQVICTHSTTDPEGDDLTFAWSWGDDSNVNPTNRLHTYRNSGTYTITLTANDGINSASKSIQHTAIGNGHPPTVTLTCRTERFIVTCQASAVDPDAQPLQYRVKWGDGQIDTLANVNSRFSHTFASEGEYAVQFYAADGQHIVMATTNVTVGTDVSDARAECTYLNNNSWGNAFQATIRITNTSDTVIDGWTLDWHYSDGSSITQLWNASLSGNNPYTASNLGWNARIQPGQSVEFGFQGIKGSATLQTPVLTGEICGG